MGRVTLQVIDGLEKGRVFAELSTPVTIGREDENHVRLNDERVSRFHAKIQEDEGKFILTDLDSTNGTRVNGHPVHMRVLQIGDQMAVGRSLLVFGIPQRPAPLADSSLVLPEQRTLPGRSGLSDADFELALPDVTGEPVDAEDELFPHGPPDMPADLRPVQAAQISDVISYVHREIAGVLEGATEETEVFQPTMQVDWDTWQRLLRLQMDLAVYLRRMADPES